MNLGEFHSLVSESLNRGTSLDARIPSKVRQAVRWIERNYTYQYMRRWLSGTIDTSLPDAEVIPLYQLYPKAIEAVRLWPSDNPRSQFHDLKRIDPKERTSRTTDVSGYWLDGVNSIILDGTPTDVSGSIPYEIHLHQYTAWPTDTNYEHWLIDNAEDMLLYTTLFYMGVSLRDSRMIADYKALRDEAQQTLHISEQEIQNNDRSASMVYNPVDYTPDQWFSDDDS